MSFSRKKLLSNLFVFLILVLSVPVATFLVQQAPAFLSRATGTTANIVVDTSVTEGAIYPNWQALAQGGEETTPYTFSAVINEIASLQPKYIRIDHIYDFYNVASKNADGSLNINFNELDVVVRDILKTGALPFFSLSYMPSNLSRDGGITSTPANWNNWKELVRRTVEHYSGTGGFNLSGVYYEVWNEPDLFGRFAIGSGEKDYLTLYAFAARGAQEALNTNQYYFGGPATTNAYPNWFNTLLDYCSRNSLPLDFLSWHFYGKEVNKLVSSAGLADAAITKYAQKPIQKIISEWGIDSENNPAFDNWLSASYTIASLKNLQGKVDLAFTFEIKDGPPVGGSGSPFWGRWGLLTHESVGKIIKPRYLALKLLNNLKGERLKVSGAGTFVDALATKENEGYKLILYNYDPSGSHFETTPVTFTNLPKGLYRFSAKSFLNKTPILENKEVSDGSYGREIIMQPNEIVLIELTHEASLFSFTQGRSEDINDQSLELVPGREIPAFSLDLPAVQSTQNSLSFWFKPYWESGESDLNYTLFTVSGAGGQTLFARFGRLGFSNQLIFGLAIGAAEQEQTYVGLPLRDWPANTWHNLRFTYGEGKLGLEVDGQKGEKVIDFTLNPQNLLQLGVAQGVIDELKLEAGGNIILQREFNGNVE